MLANTASSRVGFLLFHNSLAGISSTWNSVCHYDPVRTVLVSRCYQESPAHEASRRAVGFSKIFRCTADLITIKMNGSA